MQALIVQNKTMLRNSLLLIAGISLILFFVFYFRKSHLTANQISSLTSTQLNALTLTQIGYLGQAQVSALTGPQLMMAYTGPAGQTFTSFDDPFNISGTASASGNTLTSTASGRAFVNQLSPAQILWCFRPGTTALSTAPSSNPWTSNTVSNDNNSRPAFSVIKPLLIQALFYGSSVTGLSLGSFNSIQDSAISGAVLSDLGEVQSKWNAVILIGSAVVGLSALVPTMSILQVNNMTAAIMTNASANVSSIGVPGYNAMWDLWSMLMRNIPTTYFGGAGGLINFSWSDTRMFSSLTAAQYGAFTDAALSAITFINFNYVPATGISALPTSLSLFTSTTATPSINLNWAKFRAIHVGALTQLQIGAMNSFVNMSDAAVATLTTAQLAMYSATAIATLSSSQITNTSVLA